MVSHVSFVYNDPDILGQTIFVKRGKHQGKLGLVKHIFEDEVYEVSGGDFGEERARFKRNEFIVHRYRKVRMRADRHQW